MLRIPLILSSAATVALLEFVGFVNGVIDQMKSDGRWKAAYDSWFGRFAGPAPEPPRSMYS